MAEPLGPRYDMQWPPAAAPGHPGAHHMVDEIIGLILAVLALIYLAFAMLRPERF